MHLHTESYSFQGALRGMLLDEALDFIPTRPWLL